MVADKKKERKKKKKKEKNREKVKEGFIVEQKDDRIDLETNVYFYCM